MREAAAAMEASAVRAEVAEAGMSYEPRGKMIEVMAAVRAEPDRAFTLQEIAAILGRPPHPSTLAIYLHAALKHGSLHENIDEQGVSLFKAMPFRNGGRVNAPSAQVDPGASQVAPAWSPPKMVAPRPGSDAKSPRLTPAAVAPAAEKLPPSSPPLVEEMKRAPEPLPPIGDASIQEEVAAEVEEVTEEEDEFNAALWLDGDLIIYGAQELEDGGMLITREQLAKLKRLIAWSAL
jgi:hypothetical protein